MYKKWVLYTKKHPYLTIIVVATIASLMGITIEYLTNRNFVGGGFWVTVILILGQLVILRKKNK